MRIGIDARFYGPIKQKGLGRYLQKLIEGLEDICHCEERSDEAILSDNQRDCFVARQERTPRNDNEFIIFLRRENWDEYQPKRDNFKKVLADYRWYGFAEQIFFPLKIRQEKIDLMHFPHFNAPLFYSGDFIVTIHDLILKKYPTRRASALGPIRYFIKNLGYNLIINSAVKRTKKIIAVSEYTKKDILRYFKIEPEKVRVIYEGAPAGCHCEKRSDEAISRIIGRDCFVARQERAPRNDKEEAIFRNDKYLLYVGNAYPHKNLERLILAFQELSGDYPELKLVLVGEEDYFYRRLKKYVSSFKFQVSGNIIFTDFVSDGQLAELYRNASLYVFPSLCEGFGLPPLEAISFNLPVVCSNSSCLPEVLGEAALYFNPENIKEIAEKVRLVLENRELREKLAAAGYQRIKKYSWRKMAEEILNEYQRAR